MPSREEFEVALDASPTDWSLRLVYADWLEENGLLEEAEGQRYMARNQKAPVRYDPHGNAEFLRNGYDIPAPWLWHCGGSGWEAQEQNRLNKRLFRLVDTNSYKLPPHYDTFWSYHLTRQAAEQALINGLPDPEG